MTIFVFPLIVCLFVYNSTVYYFMCMAIVEKIPRSQDQNEPPTTTIKMVTPLTEVKAELQIGACYKNLLRVLLTHIYSNLKSKPTIILKLHDHLH